MTDLNTDQYSVYATPYYTYTNRFVLIGRINREALKVDTAITNEVTFS